MKATIERLLFAWRVDLSNGRTLYVYEQSDCFKVENLPSGDRVLSVPGLCDLGLVVANVKNMAGREKVTFSM